MSNIEMLEIYKAEAMEQLGENDRVIQAQRERIADLEYHLRRCQDAAYQMYYATANVLPTEYVPDVVPTKAKKRAKA